MSSIVFLVFIFTFPFLMGVVLVKNLTEEDIKDYIFDRTFYSSIALFLLIKLLLFISIIETSLGVTLAAQTGVTRKAGVLFFYLPGAAASFLIFSRAFRSDYQVSIIYKFWRLLAWSFLFLMLFGLMLATYF